jgi:glycine dehydrogenase subunit 1
VSYLPHSPEEIREMLERIGAPSIGALFETVPAGLRARGELKLPPPLGERALLRYLGELADRNLPLSRARSFLGAGAYDHFIPAAVDALASRSEFATSYTPYQGEISQGTLQAIFEFQTLIAQLTGLDVSNASLYDGGSAAAEAVLVALRVTRRRRVYLSEALHPHYAQVIRTYLRGLDSETEVLPLGADGRTEARALAPDAAAVVIQYPNFLGCVEDLAPFAAAAREAGALLISVTTEPLALALLRAPGELGAEVACGEAQSFGVPLSFGGPYVGFLAAREALVRQLPGRLVGQTVDAEGRRAFVLTLTTREQHIRRERATSNICTNQGLCALRVAIYLALLGRHGLRRLAEVNLALSSYARSRMRAAGLRLPYSAPTFNEFVVEAPGIGARYDALVSGGLVPGVLLETYDPARRDQLLVCATEMNDREAIDSLARELSA